MINVELVFDGDCPNVEAARAELRQAFALAGLAPSWQEWNRGDGASPARVRACGSPTILVNGADVAGLEPSADASCCRLYQRTSGELAGVPSAEIVAAALRQASGGRGQADARTGHSKGWVGSLAVLPGAGVSFLPVLACPACWPAYAGVLSSLGVGFLANRTVLLALTVGLLLLALGVLAHRPRARHGYGPLVVGVVGGALVLAAKFFLESVGGAFTGAGLLLAASLWNAWPRRRTGPADACPACLGSAGPAPRSTSPGRKDVPS